MRREGNLAGIHHEKASSIHPPREHPPLTLPSPRRGEDMQCRRFAARIAYAERRSTISFLISAIALAGFRPFGQVRVQFMMVWQR